MMTLDICKDTADVRIPRSRLLKLFEMVMETEARRTWSGTVNLVFTTDGKIRHLNRNFRGIDKPTDVLSFNIEKPVDPEATFGEIYIAVETARRQAGEYGGSLTGEILRLACHGLLHLLGYDHEKNAEATKMKSREEHFLQLLSGEN